MADVLTTEQRRYCMSRIKGRNTKPEQIVLALLIEGGHIPSEGSGLPGRPDVVIKRANLVVFVHGCFWHKHSCKWGSVVPRTRKRFWHEKLEGNVRRDRRVSRQLRALGWHTAVVWECQLRTPDRVRRRLCSLIEKWRL